MVCCLKCGQEIPPSEYSSHYASCVGGASWERVSPERISPETWGARREARARYAMPGHPPRGRHGFDISPVLKAAIGSMFRERAKYWYDLIDSAIKTYKAKGTTYQDAKEETLKFQWALSELSSIAEELGLEQELLNEIDRMRGTVNTLIMQL